MRGYHLLFALSVTVPAACAQTPAGSGQLAPEQAAALLGKAKSHYSSLIPAGVQSFRCDVAIDWPSALVSLGLDVAADDPKLQYLQSSRIHFEDPLLGSPVISWKSTGAVPAGLEQQIQVVQNGLKSMVRGFLSAWTPALNGTLIPQSAKSVVEGPEGYLVVNENPGSSATLEMNRDLLLTHVTFHASNVQGQFVPTFTPSPNGLLLTGVEEDFQTPVTAPANHISMQTKYSTVSGVQLPATVTVAAPSIRNLVLVLEGCEVERKP